MSRILLSIKSKYVDAIIAGTKKYEFRKTFGHADTIVIYSSGREKMVIGEFTIDDILYEDIDKLWFQTKAEAGIDQESFFSYFRNKQKGYAIKIGQLTLYPTPRPLSYYSISHPPQSYMYLLG